MVARPVRQSLTTALSGEARGRQEVDDGGWLVSRG